MARKNNINAQVSPLVERNDSHHQLSGDDLNHYAKQMRSMFGDTQLPAVAYKGSVIPRRVLSDYSFLTK